jgi:SAM-dependent methyltransferase
VVETWHHGLIAKWWAEFNEGGPEVQYFQSYVEAGQPALDLGCGTGRLLLPWLRTGLDVDGCDASADMIAHCREAVEREGLTSNLYVQSMHELDLPRRYRTIVVCGALGLGGRRADTAAGLRRVYEPLAPGGTFVVDNEVPYAAGNNWEYWQKGARSELPKPWGDPGERRRGADGAEYALRARVAAFDPLEQQTTYEMRAWMWRDGELVAEEEHRLDMTVYFTHEIVLMLELAGFVDIRLRAGYEDRAPTGDDDFVVFVARKPAIVAA